MIVYMGVIYMYVDCVCGYYKPVYWLYICVLYACILIVYMSAHYIYNVY